MPFRPRRLKYPHAEVRPMGVVKRPPERGQQLVVDVVEDTRHSLDVPPRRWMI